MIEIDFYSEVCEKFKIYLLSFLPIETEIAFSYNKTLPKMIGDIEAQLKTDTLLSHKYMPSLKLDILFGVKMPNNDVKFILFEAKHLNQLSLADFSQLVGYLQVAKEIKIGLLLLVKKGSAKNKLSNDFSDILMMKNLPMAWQLVLNESLKEEKHNFYTGICCYIPNNGIEWIDSKDIKGISSFKALADLLEQ